MIGIQVYRFGIVFDSLSKLAFVGISCPTIVIGIGMIGVEVYRFGIVFNGTNMIVFSVVS